MSGHTPVAWKSDIELAVQSRTTLNDLPIPAGSWQANYAKKQSKYNIQLAVASVLMGTTLAVVRAILCLSGLDIMVLSNHLQILLMPKSQNVYSKHGIK